MDDHPDASSVLTEGLRVSGRHPGPVFGSGLLACAVALPAGGGIVAGAFAVSWGLFLEARRSAESSIAYEESYVAYAGQYGDLVKVACGVYPLLLLLAMVLLAWLLTAQAVVVAHARTAVADRAALTLGGLWRRTRPHLGAAFRVQSLYLACALVFGSAGLLVLAAAGMERVPGVARPTYHEPATVPFLLVGRVLPVVIWVLGTVVLYRLSLATAVRVADGCPARAALRRSWALTRTARARTIGLCLLGTAVVAVAFVVLRWLGTYVAHWAGLLMLAGTDDNVWVTGVLVIITPVAVALVLLPVVLAPAGVVLACLRERLDGRETLPSHPSGTSQNSLTDI